MQKYNSVPVCLHKHKNRKIEIKWIIKENQEKNDEETWTSPSVDPRSLPNGKGYSDLLLGGGVALPSSSRGLPPYNILNHQHPSHTASQLIQQQQSDFKPPAFSNTFARIGGERSSEMQLLQVCLFSFEGRTDEAEVSTGFAGCLQ